MKISITTLLIMKAMLLVMWVILFIVWPRDARPEESPFEYLDWGGDTVLCPAGYRLFVPPWEKALVSNWICRKTDEYGKDEIKIPPYFPISIRVIARIDGDGTEWYRTEIVGWKGRNGDTRWEKGGYKKYLKHEYPTGNLPSYYCPPIGDSEGRLVK